jgi:carboxypeptidase Taq
VERSLIRVDADEVTYPLHVMLRYRLEKALMEGDLEVEDLPAAWNEAMGELIGITPPDDKDGVMQDVHWYEGIFGYFPTYTLGAMTAAQIFAALRHGVPDVLDQVGLGNWEPLLVWLRKNVHGQGCRFTPDGLIEHATGAPLTAAPFLAHLRARYLNEAA